MELGGSPDPAGWWGPPAAPETPARGAGGAEHPGLPGSRTRVPEGASVPAGLCRDGKRCGRCPLDGRRARAGGGGPVYGSVKKPRQGENEGRGGGGRDPAGKGGGSPRAGRF